MAPRSMINFNQLLYANFDSFELEARYSRQRYTISYLIEHFGLFRLRRGVEQQERRQRKSLAMR